MKRAEAEGIGGVKTGGVCGIPARRSGEPDGVSLRNLAARRASPGADAARLSCARAGVAGSEGFADRQGGPDVALNVSVTKEQEGFPR